MNNLAETVKAAQGGDERTRETLYLEYAKSVYYIALKLTKNREEAEDVTQESFIQAFQKITELQNPEAFPAWLNRIAANKCADLFRKRMKQPNEGELEDVDFIEEADPLLIPEKSFDNAETACMIVEIIDGLPDPQRICVYYYYYQQMTIAQIAEILGAGENTVKTRLSLAREKIRRELERLNKEEDIKLYGAVPLMLTPILKKSLEMFEMPQELIGRMLGGVTAGAASAAAATMKGAATMGKLSMGAKLAITIGSIVIAGAIIIIAVTSGGPDNPKNANTPTPTPTPTHALDATFNPTPDDQINTDTPQAGSDDEKCPYNEEYILSHAPNFQIVYAETLYNSFGGETLENARKVIRTEEGFTISGLFYVNDGEKFYRLASEPQDGVYGVSREVSQSDYGYFFHTQISLSVNKQGLSYSRLEKTGEETVLNRQCSVYSYVKDSYTEAGDITQIYWIDQETGICLKYDGRFKNDKGEDDGYEFVATEFELGTADLPPYDLG